MSLDLETIYRDHRGGFFSLALSVTGCHEQAEDVIHDVFSRLCARSFEPRGDAVAYVYASVRNAAIDRLRRERRRKGAHHDVDSLFDKAAGPAESACDAERATALAGCIDRLPERSRTTLALRLRSGLPFWQIAKILGEPLPAVTSRYRRAIQRLKKDSRRLA